MKIIYVNCGVKNYMHEERFAEVKGRIPYKTEFFSGFLFATAKVAYIYDCDGLHSYNSSLRSTTSFHGFITNQFNDLISVGLLA